MSHYLTRHCDEHGEYDADVDGDQECEECRAQGKLPYQIDKQRIATLESEVAALRAELEQHKASLPTCEKHKPSSGTRGGCVICSGHALSHALSRIDYACGEPNEMECSDYDVHYNEDEVVKRVVALRAENERLKIVEQKWKDYKVRLAAARKESSK